MIRMCNSSKYPYLPHGRDFFLRPQPPPLLKFQLSFIHIFEFFGLTELPTPLGNSSPFCVCVCVCVWGAGGGGEDGYFLELHNTIELRIVIHNCMTQKHNR